MEQLKLFTNGTVKANDREFTRIMGGFGKDKPSISDRQVADLLEYKHSARQVREQVLSNIKHFNFGTDIIDLQRADDSDTFTETLISLGYAKQSITQAKNIFIFSEAGFLLYLKFAEGDKAVELYKDFIEDYFKTKAENVVLKVTLKEQIEKLQDERDFIFGKGIRTRDPELLMKSEELNDRIIELEKQLTEELTVEKYKVFEDKYKTFMDKEGCFTFESAAKIFSTRAEESNLNIKVNRNSLPELLRNKGILCKQKSGKSYKNLPNSGYEEYFNTNPIDIEVKSKTGDIIPIQKTQTRINKKGLNFIYNILIKSVAN